MTKGFTLLELMITLLILAIALAIGAPLLSGYTQNQSIKNTAQLLNMDFNYAREQAVLRRRSIIITAAARGWNNGWRITDATNNTLLKQRDAISSNVGIISTNNTTSITFNAQGWVTGTTTMRIDVRDANAQCVNRRRRNISISATGQLSLSRTNC